MKITKTQLKKLILEELRESPTVTHGDKQNLSNIAFRTGPFTTIITVISDTLDRLIDVIRDSGDLKDEDLEGLKNNELLKLMDKIGYCESVIDAKIEGTALQSAGPGIE